MSRIVYIVPRPAMTSGGNKVTFRHVEALAALGYRTVARLLGPAPAPTWFEHAAPIERASDPLFADDILVFPEDAADALRRCAGLPNRKVVFCQNPYWAAANGLPNLTPDEQAPYRTFMACSDGVGDWVARFFDQDLIVTVPAFADERLFKPAPKEAVIACMPRKRAMEHRAVQAMFRRLYGGNVDWRWDAIEDCPEAEAAARVGPASVYLSLARLEGMSMTIVEAMASGCLVAGFTGIGPREYTTAANGFWAPEDDCEAAAHALVQAVTLAEADGAAAQAMRGAARATAAQWTHAGFLVALERFWRETMGVVP